MLSYNNYLSGCDLINKYNITNINNIPNLSLIVVEFEIGYFSHSTRNVTAVTNVEPTNQFSHFWALYAITSLEPLLKFSLIHASTKKVSGSYCLSIKIVVQKQKDIDYLLRFLFIENIKKLIKEDVKLFELSKKKLLTYKQVYTKDKRSLKVRIPGYCLFNLKSVLLTDLDVELTFIFDSLDRGYDFTNSVKNISNFWIHG